MKTCSGMGATPTNTAEKDCAQCGLPCMAHYLDDRKGDEGVFVYVRSHGKRAFGVQAYALGICISGKYAAISLHI
ncbi:hypothetical protein [Maridesulfovibrio sp.]|uniref:hypothetical protein n=1 Tax=Maridesulfovibrio sp. TaxID=2795000 RepID=UPI002A18B023|nr:hypothetical protein [Maridesulfovibrio sp.]